MDGALQAYNILYGCVEKVCIVIDAWIVRHGTKYAIRNTKKRPRGSKTVKKMKIYWISGIFKYMYTTVQFVTYRKKNCPLEIVMYIKNVIFFSLMAIVLCFMVRMALVVRTKPRFIEIIFPFSLLNCNYVKCSFSLFFVLHGMRCFQRFTNLYANL